MILLTEVSLSEKRRDLWTRSPPPELPSFYLTHLPRSSMWLLCSTVSLRAQGRLSENGAVLLTLRWRGRVLQETCPAEAEVRAVFGNQEVELAVRPGSSSSRKLKFGCLSANSHQRHFSSMPRMARGFCRMWGWVRNHNHQPPISWVSLEVCLRQNQSVMGVLYRPRGERVWSLRGGQIQKAGRRQLQPCGDLWRSVCWLVESGKSNLVNLVSACDIILDLLETSSII